MATNVQLRGLNCTDTVLFPQNEDALLKEIRKVVPKNLQRRIIDESIEKILISLRHKLTVAMYQAALLCKLDPNDFTRFKIPDEKQHSEGSYTIYKRCLYEMRDIDEYRFILSFLIETFAATAFSLFDVAGHLLNNLYGLGQNSDQISFHGIQAQLQNSSLHSFLSCYTIGNTHSVPWIDTLKKIRNHTTHRPIVDVCDFKKEERADIYAKHSHELETIFLLNDSLVSSGNPIEFCDFVKEVFDGLEEFVEELYDQLRIAVHNTGGLPVS